MAQINWGILQGAPDPGAAFSQGYDRGRTQARDRATQDALRTYGANPTGGVPAALWSLDPKVAATVSQNDRQRVAADRQTATDLREAQARTMVPDVLAGLSLGGDGGPIGAATTDANGEITVTGPVQHKTIADLYALDPALAGRLVSQVGDMEDQRRKKLSFEADTLAAAAFAARQVPYEKRRSVIDQHRRQLNEAGFSHTEVDEFDPSDEALAAAITQSLGVKGALAQHLSEERFAWQRQDDLIDNRRDDRRVAIQDRSARDASARGWSADRRAEKRYNRGDGMNVGTASTEDLLRMLEGQ